MVDDQKFFAWLDGELSGSEARLVEAEVAADPELSRRAAEHRAMASRLRAAFEPVARAPVPERLAATARGDGRIASLAEARSRNRERVAPPVWKQVAAMAATLALGILVGNGLIPASTSPIEPESGRLVASGKLENALYRQLASAPWEEGPRVGLTFRERGGGICRTFQDESASGLACREGGDWRIRAVFQAGEGQGSDYRMAAGPDPALMEIVESSIEGEPFDEAQERAARDRDWR